MKARTKRILATALAAVLLTGAGATTATTQATAAPSRFGPDGTHYPSKTPDIRKGLSKYTVKTVPASATAIRRALDKLTAKQIDRGAVIRVKPGNISSMAPLTGYHNNRSKKVLVMARDGFESVTGTSGWTFTDIEGLSFMRFEVKSFDVKGAVRCSFGWIRVTGNYFGVTPWRGKPSRNVQFIEIVEPTAVVKSTDSAGVKAYASGILSKVLIEGSYIAPSYYLDGNYGVHGAERPHNDSLQVDGYGITDAGITMRDTAVFASNNSAIIIGGVPNITFDHTLVVGGTVAAQRYPFKPGGAGYIGASAGPGSLSAIQGSGGGRVNAYDSTFIGGVQVVWNDTRNTRVTDKNEKAASGRFLQRPALAKWTKSDLDAVSRYPSKRYLRTIWNDYRD